MTRKDFILIAKAVDASRPPRTAVAYAIDTETIDAVARRLADALATTNGQFKRERFLTACGVVS